MTVRVERQRNGRASFACPTGKGGHLKAIRGGRVPKSAGFSPVVAELIERRAAAWGVSWSAVVASAVAFAFGRDSEDV